MVATGDMYYRGLKLVLWCKTSREKELEGCWSPSTPYILSNVGLEPRNMVWSMRPLLPESRVRQHCLSICQWYDRQMDEHMLIIVHAAS